MHCDHNINSTTMSLPSEARAGEAHLLAVAAAAVAVARDWKNLRLQLEFWS